jgi:hypothetical protein
MPDPSAIENQQVSRRDEPGHVAEASVFQFGIMPPDYEQSAGSALGDGILRDELGWERVVEVGGGVGHGDGEAGSRWWGVGGRDDWRRFRSTTKLQFFTPNP